MAERKAPKVLDDVYRLRDEMAAFNDRIRDLIDKFKKKKRRRKPKPGDGKRRPRRGGRGGDYSALGQNTPQIITELSDGRTDVNGTVGDCMKNFPGNDTFDTMGKLGCQCKYGNSHACKKLSEMIQAQRDARNN